MAGAPLLTPVAEGQSYLNLALQLAARGAQNLNTVEELIRRGCRPTAKITIELVKRGDPAASLKVLKTLVQNHGLQAGANVTERDGTSAISIAARRGQLEQCQFLLEQGADINLADWNKQSPLHWAASLNRADIVRLLLENGADQKAEDTFSCTPFCWAVKKGHVETLEAFLEQKIPIDAVSIRDVTPLCKATGASSRWLLDHGAKVDRVLGGVQHTPLFHAVRDDNVELVKVLLNAGADINRRDKYGQTCLYYAVRKGFLAMTQLLVEEGADVLAKDRTGCTAAGFSKRHGAGSEALSFALAAEAALLKEEKRKQLLAAKEEKRKRALQAQEEKRKRLLQAQEEKRKRLLQAQEEKRKRLLQAQEAGPRRKPRAAATARKDQQIREQVLPQEPALSTSRKRKNEAHEDDTRRKFRLVDLETMRQLSPKQWAALLTSLPWLKRGLSRQ